MKIDSESWQRASPENVVHNEEYEIVELWGRIVDDNISIYMLVYKIEADKYMIKSSTHKVNTNPIKMFKEMIKNRFRNVSIDFGSGKVNYTGTQNEKVKIQNLRDVSEYDSKKEAQKNLQEVLN